MMLSTEIPISSMSSDISEYKIHIVLLCLMFFVYFGLNFIQKKFFPNLNRGLSRIVITFISLGVAVLGAFLCR